ncbi:uncharacterized protein LOC134281936 [Saccostrea cucullata]|uniref:uncharacterized protein LOC134281936 n=1 Tax=Saccostrea cuccullata TaxID=36930 RepID=UPI002ED01758
MAVHATKIYPLGSPQNHNEMCGTHELPIDMICEDCDEFICGDCAKSNHRDHAWKTISTAAIERRKGLHKFLKKIKEEDLHNVDEKLKKIPQQITENKQLCDSEIEKLQKHYDEIMARLTKIKNHHENTMKNNLVKKNDQLNHVKSELEKKKRGILDTLKFVEENNTTMSDYSLIDNHRELIKLLSELAVHMTKHEYSVRFTRGEINEEFLESLVGKTLDLDNIGATQENKFQHGEKRILSLEKFSEDQCYIYELNSKYIEKVNQQGTKEHRFSTNAKINDICVTDNRDVYFTDISNNSIRCLSPSGSVSTVLSTNPLGPVGICQSIDGGLLLTLRDLESDLYKLDSNSRRLMRHITVTGDVIHEYEYQEDGKTRLFTLPVRVAQNNNSDICVVNSTSLTSGELVIMSPSGRMKSVYRGQNLAEDFRPGNAECD